MESVSIPVEIRGVRMAKSIYTIFRFLPLTSGWREAAFRFALRRVRFRVGNGKWSRLPAPDFGGER